ncbi:unnamed protein product [Sphagnum troendelagicum]|uniref:Uncharacterized protein n=1 Tax=Sphagnum troendelagicum TaxID=128251 RepID=A0ABP0UWU4_9BRYO
MNYLYKFFEVGNCTVYASIPCLEDVEGQTTTHISISTDTIVKQTTLATYLHIMKMPCCNFGTAPSILRCLSRKCCSSFGTISSILRSMSRNCCNFGTSHNCTLRSMSRCCCCNFGNSSSYSEIQILQQHEELRHCTYTLPIDIPNEPIMRQQHINISQISPTQEFGKIS